MSLCSWPRGCFQECGPGDDRCYYHTKVVSGLITPDWYLFEPHTYKPPPSRRDSLARALATSGAADVVVQGALQVPMYPRHFSRHGSGFVRSGTVSIRMQGVGHG